MNEQNSFKVENGETYRVEILNTIKKGLGIYKNNFKLLMGISFLGVLLSMVSILITYFKTHVVNSTLTVVLNVSEKIMILPTIYFGAMLTICMYICISEIYHERPVTFVQGYRDSHERFWRYLGTSIAYSLLCVPTIILAVIVIFTVKMKILMGVLLIVASIPAAYWGTIYVFVLFAAVFENKNTACFKYSKEMVKGNFWRILLLTLIISGPKLLDVGIRLFSTLGRPISNVSSLPVDTADTFIFAFIAPAVASILATLYFTLSKEYINKLGEIPASSDLLD